MSAEISTDLRRVLRRLKLSPVLATLPERLVLARSRKLPHAEFLEVVLSDEVERRDLASATRRARAAGLDPAMVLDAWDDEARVSYDRELWAELATLRFMDDAHGVLVLGPVGVGKTHCETASTVPTGTDVRIGPAVRSMTRKSHWLAGDDAFAVDLSAPPRRHRPGSIAMLA
jgi:DNA replication protein DnaC